MTLRCVEYRQAAVLFDEFEAVTKSILLYIFGCSFNSSIARNSVTTLTLLTLKNVLLNELQSNLLVLFKED
jgi:hypothetical protein